MSERKSTSSEPHSSGLMRGLKWIAGPLALVAVVGWVIASRQASATARPQTDGASPVEAAIEPSYAASSLGAAARQDLSRAAQASAARDAARIVADRNQASAQDRAAFKDDGWEIVKVAPPDAKVVGLDPALVDGREDDLRVQIASTVARPAEAGKLGEIARRARTPETRTAAVEALGRIHAAEAQRELFKLLTEAGLPAGDPARSAIAPLLRPSELHEPYAVELVQQLDSPRLTEVERKQIAFSLVLVGLRDGTEIPAAALQSLSPAARELLRSMTALATQSNPLPVAK